MTYVKRLVLEHFRNYRECEVSFSPGINVIYGDNAQGKTNLLEAVGYLSSAKSFRTHNDREMIEFGQEGAGMGAELVCEDREIRIDIRLFSSARRRLLVNGIPRRTAADFSGTFRTVLFSPEDLYLIKEGAAIRRRFMDYFLCQIRPRYFRALSEYSRLYEHKLRILKDCAEKPSLLSALEDFNLKMAQTGAVLIHYRGIFSELLSRTAAGIHGDFSGGAEELSIGYRTVKTIPDPAAQPKEILPYLLAHQESHRRAELEARACLSGPHKDDLELFINGKPAKNFASQGQTRTAALSMKLAERELHFNDSGQYPVLLLDDVLSELDPRRQEFVLNRINGGQTFVTCCEDERLGKLKEGAVFHVKDGFVKQ